MGSGADELAQLSKASALGQSFYFLHPVLLKGVKGIGKFSAATMISRQLGVPIVVEACDRLRFSNCSFITYRSTALSSCQRPISAQTCRRSLIVHLPIFLALLFYAISMHCQDRR